jgi:hypothetical protein
MRNTSTEKFHQIHCGKSETSITPLLKKWGMKTKRETNNWRTGSETLMVSFFKVCCGAITFFIKILPIRRNYFYPLPKNKNDTNTTDYCLRIAA